MNTSQEERMQGILRQVPATTPSHMSRTFVSPSGGQFRFNFVMSADLPPNSESAQISGGHTFKAVLAMPEHAAAIAYMNWLATATRPPGAATIGFMVMNTQTFMARFPEHNALQRYIQAMITHGRPDVSHMLWVASEQ